ncbi:MAG: hypothetical protein OXI75_09760 [Rhodospirillales bacterium]|nr:hypothetical protein [Rhodospirillales bacterium]
MSGYSLTADDIAFRACGDGEWLVLADGESVGTVMKRPAYTTPDHGVYYVHLYDDHAGPVAVEDAHAVRETAAELLVLRDLAPVMPMVHPAWLAQQHLAA